MFLDAAKSKETRAEEMRSVKNLGVYNRAPQSRVMEFNGNMATVKWLDTNKGDAANPN